MEEKNVKAEVSVEEMSDRFEDFVTERNDELDNAAFELAKLMTKNENLEWDMSFIGDILDSVEEIMYRHQEQTCYPYWDEDDEDRVPCFMSGECDHINNCPFISAETERITPAE